ncbi:carbohydrate-binding module family 14 protein [Streptomyces sulphureus]|uniref:carbohydrate-binding module family 14 protein n=1 Tax=Streptomyces sulphureus TaxID=47758 RepID=UPI000361AB3F|nr:carbohydrate-binding module family 14 protein [Streptomyces sulphureus]
MRPRRLATVAALAVAGALLPLPALAAATAFGGPAPVCQENGLFPHAEDARYFHHCSGHRPHLKKCPANLRFDPQLRVCAYAKKANTPRV